VRRPKVYWRDSGLLHCLLGIGADDDLVELPTVGLSWEGHVIDQVLTALHQAGRRFEAWHLRTAEGREIDLVVRVDRELWAIEAKLTSRPGRSAMTRLNENANLIGAHRRFLVTRQAESFSSGAQTACSLDGMVAAAIGPMPALP